MIPGPAPVLIENTGTFQTPVLGRRQKRQNLKMLYRFLIEIAVLWYYYIASVKLINQGQKKQKAVVANVF